MEQQTPTTGPATASLPDTLRAVAFVLVPLVARGVIIRRPLVVALLERLDADRRLVRTLQRLRRRHGVGPLLLRLPLRRVVLVLADDDVHRVLAASPDPFATAAREKRAALDRFEPHGVLISDAADRPDRRRWNEAVLDTPRPLHHLAGPMTSVVREEARALLDEVTVRGGVLDWPTFTAAWFRVVRRVTLGDAARDDTALTDALTRLRALGNWAMFAPRRPALTAGFRDRLRAHLHRAEPGSLAAVAATTPATPHTAALEQVPQWLFAFDAAGMAAFRALALLVTHPDGFADTRAVAGADGRIGHGTRADPGHATLRAALLESVRLWPTTPAILRETTTPADLGGVPLPPRTLVLVAAPFFHRDGERHEWADRFAPELWPADAARGAGTPAALVPFSAGPAMCPGQNLVLFLTSTFLAALIEGNHVAADRVPIRPGRPLPGTLDPFRLRFTVTPAP
jgi:cytochrome P450